MYYQSICIMHIYKLWCVEHWERLYFVGKIRKGRSEKEEGGWKRSMRKIKMRQKKTKICICKDLK